MTTSPRIALQIDAAAGFSGAEVMNQVFRRELGRAPAGPQRGGTGRGRLTSTGAGWA